MSSRRAAGWADGYKSECRLLLVAGAQDGGPGGEVRLQIQNSNRRDVQGGRGRKRS